MGLNWAVCLPGLFAATIAGTLYMLWIVILVNFFGFLVLKPCSPAPWLFDFSSRELVPLPDNTCPAEFWDNRSSTVSVITANVERRNLDIGRYTLSRKKIFGRADWTILWRHPPEFTTIGFGSFGNAPEETWRTVWAVPSPRFWYSSTDGDNAKRLWQAEGPWNNVTWTAINHEVIGE